MIRLIRNYALLAGATALFLLTLLLILVIGPIRALARTIVEHSVEMTGRALLRRLQREPDGTLTFIEKVFLFVVGVRKRIGANIKP